MKKTLLYIVLAVLCFSSCKKDEKPVTPPIDNNKTYSIKFRIADFNGQKTNKTGSNIKVNDVVSIPSSVTRIIYVAVNSQNKIVTQILQEKTASNFGSIDDNLPAGTYTIYVCAGSGDIDVTEKLELQKGLVDGTVPLPTYFFWGDTFATSFQITVANQPIDQSVSLHRIVGQVSVKLLDQLPASAHSLKVTVSNDYLYYNLVTDKPSDSPADEYAYFSYANTETRIIPPSAIGTANYTQSYNILNTGASVNHTITILCLDSGGRVIANAVVNNVIVQRNTNTILSGKLFGQNAGFTIALDQSWETPINVGF